MNSLIPWVGGKGKLLWLIHKLAPSSYERFIDVFGGGGTVTLNHPLQHGCIEIYNDYNSNLTNLFCCVKNRTMALLKELGFLPLNSRDDFNVLFKFFSNLYMKTVVSLQNNLISLTDKTFPGVNELFSSPERADGHQKWVDFVMTFWHCDCICRVSEKAFTERYQKWCKRKGYHFSTEKALDLYAGSCGHFTTLPKNDNTKLLITTAAQQLLSGKMTLAALRAEITRLAMQLPEYDTVRAMYGVGETTAAQLMAEIGDVRRFPRRSSIVGFAGVDPAVDQSGKHEAQSTPTTKRGSPHLRKTLYQIVCTYLRKAPAGEPVYQFLDKKRAEGKPYFVYMTAAQNKFLRIYYARVKECLEAFDARQDTTQS